MTRFTYKIVPAPARGLKAGGVKGPEARFAHGLETAINEWAAQGWEYLRAEILPSEERSGLTGTRMVQRGVLVFRRPVEAAPAAESAREARAMPPLTARRPVSVAGTQDPGAEDDPPATVLSARRDPSVAQPEDPPLLRR